MRRVAPDFLAVDFASITQTAFAVEGNAMTKFKNLTNYDPKPWAYPEHAPVFEKAGEYVAWKSASGAGNDFAASAWRLQPADRSAEFVEECKRSEGTSSVQRGYIGAAIGVCESLVER